MAREPRDLERMVMTLEQNERLLNESVERLHVRIESLESHVIKIQSILMTYESRFRAVTINYFILGIVIANCLFSIVAVILIYLHLIGYLH